MVGAIAASCDSPPVAGSGAPASPPAPSAAPLPDRDIVTIREIAALPRDETGELLVSVKVDYCLVSKPGADLLLELNVSGAGIYQTLGRRRVNQGKGTVDLTAGVRASQRSLMVARVDMRDPAQPSSFSGLLDSTSIGFPVASTVSPDRFEIRRVEVLAGRRPGFAVIRATIGYVLGSREEASLALSVDTMPRLYRRLTEEPIKRGEGTIELLGEAATADRSVWSVKVELLPYPRANPMFSSPPFQHFSKSVFTPGSEW